MSIPKGGVAFFDSGIGGLTVLSACLSTLRGLPVYYFGDNARAPYGNKGKEELAPYVFEAFDLLASLRPQAAVIACNTVTALFIDELRARYAFPIVGTEPAVRLAAKGGGEIFVLATKATVNSARMRALATQTEKEFANVKIRLLSCGKLAGEIERHILEKGYDFTPFLPIGNPNAVVLGCTHYAYIQKTLEGFYGCPTFHGNEGIVKVLAKNLPVLGKNRDEKTEKKPPDFFQNTGRLFKRKNSLKISRFLKNFSPKKCKKIQKLKFVQPLYFLGSDRFFNANFYKQMFVFKPSVGEVVKNPKKNQFF